MPSIVWFRRDLRVHDLPALRAALDESDEVVPFFCLDDRLLHGRFASGPRTQFLLECLEDLDSSLRERGGALVVRRGDPAAELRRLADELGADSVHVSRELTPYGRARGRRVGRVADGLRISAHPGIAVVEDVAVIETQQGRPYTVFSPFHRRWLASPRREPGGAPRKIRLPAGIDPGSIPSLEKLGFERELADPMIGGETAARELLKRFLARGVRDYAANHDDLGADRTSRLSPYLHFGCVSPREIEKRLPGGRGPDSFRRQLCWRDFYLHVLYHHPDNRTAEFQERYRGAISWSDDDDSLRAWKDGRTGFPLVDAGMRQLLSEGWMHNRARLVVGSFLTKDLGIDWRKGEEWFMQRLLDGDEANNNGNWQWIGSVGTDPQPYFRRIYNPALQMQRHDPDGIYVRKHVPELGGVPDRWLREPWRMPADVQRDCGCVIGRDYPEPIVDRQIAREAALARYRAAVK